MEFCPMENLGSVDVADTRDHFLIEQSDFHRSAAGLQPLAKFHRRYLQGIRTEPIRSDYGCQLFGAEQMKGTQASHAPEKQRCPVGELDHGTNVVCVRRICKQYATRHSRLENDRVLRVELDDHAFRDTPDTDDRPPLNALPKGTLPGTHFDVAKTCFWKSHRSNPLPDNGRDPAAHGFDFGKFGHGWNGIESGEISWTA
jgi:hypothetical protein